MAFKGLCSHGDVDRVQKWLAENEPYHNGDLRPFWAILRFTACDAVEGEWYGVAMAIVSNLKAAHRARPSETLAKERQFLLNDMMRTAVEHHKHAFLHRVQAEATSDDAAFFLPSALSNALMYANLEAAHWLHATYPAEFEACVRRYGSTFVCTNVQFPSENEAAFMDILKWLLQLGYVPVHDVLTAYFRAVCYPARRALMLQHLQEAVPPSTPITANPDGAGACTTLGEVLPKLPTVAVPWYGVNGYLEMGTFSDVACLHKK